MTDFGPILYICFMIISGPRECLFYRLILLLLCENKWCFCCHDGKGGEGKDAGGGRGIDFVGGGRKEREESGVCCFWS